MSEVETPAQATPQADATTQTEATPANTVLGSTPEAAKAEVTKESPEAAKPAEAASVVPEKYELKLPEGSKLPEAHLEQVSAFAKDKGLTNDVAQALLERESALVQGFEKAQLEALQAKSQTWLSDIRADKEFGGDKFNETAELAKRSIEYFGDDEIKKAFDLTGVGNHPSFIKMHAKIGRMMASDKFVSSNSDSASNERTEDVLYPSMKKK